MESYIVDIAKKGDVHYVAKLFDEYRQFYEQEADLQLAAEYIANRISNNDSVILVAFDSDHNPAGFCQLYPSFCSVDAVSIYILYDLFVDRDFRRKGVAKLLLLSAEEYAIKQGYSRLELSTAKVNHSAQQLYEALGWERDNDFYYYSRQINS